MSLKKCDTPTLPPGGQCFEHTWIYTTWGLVYTYLMISGLTFLVEDYKVSIFFSGKTWSPPPPYPSETMIWRKLNLFFLWMLLQNLRFSGLINFENKIFIKLFAIHFYIKLDFRSWPHPTPREHDLSRYEYTLPANASTQIWAFPAKLILEKTFLKKYRKFSLLLKCLPLQRTWPFIWINFNLLFQVMLCAK